MSEHTVTITDNKTGKQIELPVMHPTLGPDAVDIGRFFREMGYFTYDPGFLSTASCQSSLTYLDGGEGELLYRGYPIEQLAEKSSFIEVAYLMLHGELPDQAQLQSFNRIIIQHTMLNESLRSLFQGFYHDAHPMAIMVGVVGSLSAFYHDSTDITNPTHRKIAAHRMIAKMPTIAAASYKHSIGEPQVYPDNSLSYTGNLLKMMFSVLVQADPGHQRRRRRRALCYDGAWPDQPVFVDVLCDAGDAATYANRGGGALRMGRYRLLPPRPDAPAPQRHATIVVAAIAAGERGLFRQGWRAGRLPGRSLSEATSTGPAPTTYSAFTTTATRCAWPASRATRASSITRRDALRHLQQRSQRHDGQLQQRRLLHNGKQAQPGDLFIAVTEATGGGWGSIFCQDCCPGIGDRHQHPG